MGRSAKSTRGGNKTRINPGRLQKKFVKQGMGEHAAEVAARAATKMASEKNKANASSGPQIANAPKTQHQQVQEDSSSNSNNNNDNNNQNLSASATAAAAIATAVAETKQQLQPKKTNYIKSSIAGALQAIQKQRTMTEQRTVVKQAQRRR